MTTEVVVITGGASGFGRALGECCAERGHQVALLERDGERAEAEAEAFTRTHGVAAIGLTVDVTDDGSVRAAADAVLDRFGRADVVISNVGVQLFGAVERLTDAEWRWVLDANVIGAARTVRAFLPALRDAPAGRLAFTLSSSVLDPAARMAAYQASKFALLGLAETLRLELRDDGITVTAVFPSGMASRHLETSAAAQPDELRRDIGEPADFEAMVASNPGMVQAVCSPEEAARNVIDDLLDGVPYAITHGDLVGPLGSRHDRLHRAATKATKATEAGLRARNR